jgi:peptide/nickel transport system substrate-binding protein
LDPPTDGFVTTTSEVHMSLHVSTRGRLGLAIGAVGTTALLLAGCAGGTPTGTNTNGGSSDEPIIVGTTDKVTTLDPAGSYDNGSLAVQTQVFPDQVNTSPSRRSSPPPPSTRSPFPPVSSGPTATT